MATKLIGLERLRRKINAIPDAVRTQMRADLQKSAEELVSLQKSLAPVDDGDLKDSIDWTFGDAPGSASARGVFVGTDVDIKATVYAGSDKAYYARWVEHGTAPGERGKRTGIFGAKQHKTHGRKSYRTHPGTPAQPFFFPAYRALRKRIKSRISRGIVKATRSVRGQ